MTVRPLSAMYLLILCTASTGCGGSTEPTTGTIGLAAKRNAEPVRKTAEEEEAEKQATEKKSAEETAAQKKAAVKKVAQKKAAANTYFKVKVEVELCGVLTSTDEGATVSTVTHVFGTDQLEEDTWVLDFSEEKAIRAKARSLDGETVLVRGSAILRGIKSKTETSYDPESKRTRIGKPGLPDLRVATKSVLDLEPKVTVKSLVAATKK